MVEKKRIIILTLLVILIIPITVGEALDLTVIIIGEDPVADAGGPYTCYSKRSKRFDGSDSTDVDGTIVVYNWNFGDGKTGSGIKPYHTYSSTGTYTLNLTVTDNDNLTNSDTTTVRVRKYSSPPSPPPYIPPPPPNELPVAEAGPDQVIYVEEFAEFNGIGSTDSDGVIINYEWDFGDDIVEDGISISHRYLEVGNYTVTLTVRDDRNGVDTDMCTVTVQEIPPIIPDPPLPPILDDLTVTPTEIDLGDSITVRINIANIDTQPITYIINIQIGELTFPIRVDLEPSESRLISHTIVPSTIGEYNVTVVGMNAKFVVRASPYVPKPAEFVISELKVSPDPVWEGRQISFSIELSNIGETDGSHMIEFKIDGEIFYRRDLSVVAGTSRGLLIPYEALNAGTYHISVGDLTDTFTVRAPLTPAEFVLSNFTCTSEIYKGEPFELSIYVVNVGESAGQVVTTIKIDGNVTHTLESYLEPGGEVNQTWISFDLYEVGNHTIQVDVFEGTFNVVAEPVGPLPFWERPSTLIGGAVIIIVVAGIVMYIYTKGADYSGWD